MIATPGEPDLPVLVPDSFHEQTDEELTENDIKRMDADDQAIQKILLGLLEDVYTAVDSCEIAKEIWERVRKIMKDSDIGEQEKKAKLFNEWEKFTSTDGESIESYYHRFVQLMNDLKRNKHFSENIAANLKFLNNLQPEWKRHVTIVRQTKNLYEADFTQIYDFLKMNQDEVNELRAERLAKTHDPLAFMAHSQNSYNFPATHNEQSSSSTHSQQSFPINNKYNPQPSLNQNFMQPPMASLEDINDPTKAINAALILFAKAFQLNALTNNNQRTSSNTHKCQIAQPGMNMSHDRQNQNNGGTQVARNEVENAGAQSGGNQNGLVVRPVIANQNGTGNIVAARAKGTGNGNQARCYNCRGLGHIARNCTARPRRRDVAYLQTQLLIAQKEEVGIQVQAEEFDFMADAGDLDEIEEVKAKCILMEEQYTDLLEPIPEPQLVPQNDNHVTSVDPSMVQSGGTVETSSAPNEETRAHQETVYYNLVDQVSQHISTSGTQFDKALVYYTDGSAEKMALGYSNPSYLKKAQLKQQSLHNDLSDDTTPSIAQKFLNEVKNSLVTLQRVVKQKMTLEIHNWSSSAHKEVHKIISHEIAPIINQVDARVQNFEIQFLQEAAKFIRDFKSLAKEADESLDKQKSLELEIERLLKASVKKLELCIIKKEKEYAALWNNWYTKCKECKYDKISYDKAYHDMQQKVERLQAQLRDLKGTSVTPQVDKPKLIAVTPYSKKLHASITSHSVPQPREFNVMKHSNVIAPEMFKIDPSQTFKENVSSEMINASSTGLVHTARTRRPQPKGNTRNTKVPSTSKSSEVKKNVSVEDHRKSLLLSKNKKTMSSEWFKERLAYTPKPRPPRVSLKWSPSGCSFDLKGKLKFLGTVRFGNDHIDTILGYGDLKWGNITITSVYFVEGLGHNLFSVGQFCDADLEVAFRRNTCFIRDLDGVDLLKGNCWVIIYIDSLNLSTVSFGVDAAIKLKEKY
uniref:CCHC-type domain-containing protein n=1 Tax=Tanacetum cinerariifolium TaxID=118510 RepID=A0A6L2JED1_TANCI|nr:hypothetical protein [Tanacetum cinerariifolium]